MQDLANRVQLTTDGHRPYLQTVEDAFGSEIDHAMLVDLYGPDPEQERRYSPPQVIDTDVHMVQGRACIILAAPPRQSLDF